MDWNSGQNNQSEQPNSAGTARVCVGRGVFWLCGRSHSGQQQQQQRQQQAERQAGRDSCQTHIRTSEWTTSSRHPDSPTRTDARTTPHTLTDNLPGCNIHFGFVPVLFFFLHPEILKTVQIPTLEKLQKQAQVATSQEKQLFLLCVQTPQADGLFFLFFYLFFFCFFAVLPQQRPSCPQPRLHVFTHPNTRAEQAGFGTASPSCTNTTDASQADVTAERDVRQPSHNLCVFF